MFIVELPDKSIARMELTEKMISYYGGKVFEYKPGNVLKFNADLLENNDEEKEIKDTYFTLNHMMRKQKKILCESS